MASSAVLIIRVPPPTVSPIAVSPAPVATAEAPPVNGIAATPARAIAAPAILVFVALFFFFISCSAISPTL